MNILNNLKMNIDNNNTESYYLLLNIICNFIFGSVGIYILYKSFNNKSKNKYLLLSNLPIIISYLLEILFNYFIISLIRDYKENKKEELLDIIFTNEERTTYYMSLVITYEYNIIYFLINTLIIYYDNKIDNYIKKFKIRYLLLTLSYFINFIIYYINFIVFYIFKNNNFIETDYYKIKTKIVINLFKTYYIFLGITLFIKTITLSFDKNYYYLYFSKLKRLKIINKSKIKSKKYKSNEENYLETQNNELNLIQEELNIINEISDDSSSTPSNNSDHINNELMETLLEERINDDELLLINKYKNNQKKVYLYSIIATLFNVIELYVIGTYSIYFIIGCLFDIKFNNDYYSPIFSIVSSILTFCIIINTIILLLNKYIYTKICYNENMIYLSIFYKYSFLNLHILFYIIFVVSKCITSICIYTWYKYLINFENYEFNSSINKTYVDQLTFTNIKNFNKYDFKNNLYNNLLNFFNIFF